MRLVFSTFGTWQPQRPRHQSLYVTVTHCNFEKIGPWPEEWCPITSSQEVAAECRRKQLELEVKLRAAEEANNILAQMELEGEEIEEEGCQPLDRHPQGQTGILERERL